MRTNEYNTAYEPLMYLLPSGRSMTSEVGLSMCAREQANGALPAFKQTLPFPAGATGSDTWIVLGAVALLAAQPLTIR